MTTPFYRLMIVTVATLMSLIGCNNDPSSETDTGMDTLYGIPDTGYDAADAEASPDNDIDWGNTPDPEALPDTDDGPDNMYGPVETEYQDDDGLLDTEGDLYQDDFDEYEDTMMYGDVYTEYDADLGPSDEDELLNDD